MKRGSKSKGSSHTVSCLLLIVLTFLCASAASAATLRFSPATYNVAENAASLSIRLELVLDTPGECTGLIHVAEGTATLRAVDTGSATAGQDFNPFTLAVPIGVTGMPPISLGRTIPDLVLDDTEAEGNETFALALSFDSPPPLIECQPSGTASPFPLTLNVAPPATVTIFDDEPVDDGSEPELSVGNARGREGDSGETPFTFPVTLSEPAPAGGVTVNFSTVDGSATAGQDYRSRRGVLRFLPGQTRRIVTVAVLGDRRQEADETFGLVLANPDGATLVDAQGRGTIIDDDRPGGISVVGEVERSGAAGRELPGPLVVAVRNGAGRPVAGVTVRWRVVSGLAQLAEPQTTTDDEGRALNRLTLGPRPGQVVVEAQLPGDGGSVTFTITAVISLDPSRFGRTERPVADLLNIVCLRADLGADLNDLCDSFSALTDDEQPQALRAIAPEEVAAQESLADAQFGQMRQLGQRLQVLRSGTASGLQQIALQFDGLSLSSSQFAARRPHRWEDSKALRHLLERAARGLPTGAPPAAKEADADPAYRERLGLFVSANLGRGKSDASDLEDGFDLDSVDITAGVDYRLRPQLVLGGAIGYTASDVEVRDEGGRVDTQGFTLSTYGLWTPGRFYMEWTLLAGRSDVEVERGINFPRRVRLVARGEPEARQLSAGLGGGWSHSFGAWNLDTSLHGDYSETTIDAYRERGAGAFSLAIEDQEVESLLGRATLQLSRAVSLKKAVLVPTFRFSYLHEFLNDSREIRARLVLDPGSSRFAINTDEPDRDFLQVGAGLSAVFPRGHQAFLFYETDLERDDLEMAVWSFGFRIAL